MPKNAESLNNDLFNLLRSRGYQPTLLGTDGKEIPVPDEAEVFQFHFIKDNEDYGPVTISIDGLHKLVIYFGDSVAKSPSEESHNEDTSWYSLLNHLKRFSQQHQLSFEVKNTDHLKYDMAKRNNMKKIDETKGKSPYGPGGLVRDPPEKEIGVKIGKGGMKQFKVKTPPKKDKVEEAAKWRQGYSASGHPPGFKHKSGEVGPIGGTFHEPITGYDGDTTKMPVQKYRDKEDELAGRAGTKLSVSGKPLLPRNAQNHLKMAIKQSKGKHGPVGVLPEGLGDDFADMARGMKNKDGSPRFANVRQGKPPVKPAGKATAPRAAEKGATSPADWYDQASGGRRYTGDSKVPTGTMVEGYYATGRKSSYSDNVPQVKIILQHSRQLEEGERRYRAIERIFVENAAGERFLLDTTKPGLARVYARHIAEGGTPYDEQGKHIHSLCEEYTKMAGFVRATRNGQFNESTQSLVNEGVNHYNNLRETLHKMAGRRGYNAYFESWTPTLTEDEDSTDLSEMFASTELDPRIESVMPILRKLNKNITEVDHSAELAEWADEVIDEALGMEKLDEIGDKKADDGSDVLSRYKKKAGEQSSAADRAGDFEKGHKRFKGIVKATKKQFANDNKPKQVEEDAMGDFLAKGGQVKVGKPSKGPRHPGTSMASSHIGGSGDRMKASRTGIGARGTSDTKPVVSVRETVTPPVAPQVAKVLKSLGYSLNSKESMPGELKSWWNKPASGHLSMADLAKALTAVDPSFKPKPNYQYSSNSPEQMTKSIDGAGQLIRTSFQGDKLLFVSVYKRKKQGGLAKRDYDNGLDPGSRYDGMNEGDGLESNNPEGIPEATNPRQTQPNYPDTKQGAAASFAENADERFVKEMDLPNCKVWPDPQTEGVWAIDNYTTGVRVIVYLAGYRGPMGDIRGPYDDFEEGQIPKREMMRHRRNDQAQNDVEDEMMENLGPEQKKVGQAGPTDKAPLRGKLVGACESADKKKPDFAAKFKKNIDKTNKKADDTKDKVKQHTPVKEGQKYPDNSNSGATRSIVIPNLKDYKSDKIPWKGITKATRVDPTITPTTVKKVGAAKAPEAPAFLKKEVKEGDVGLAAIKRLLGK